MKFYMYADAAPSEAIQPHDLPGLAVACLMPHKNGTPILSLPFDKQYKDWNPKTRDVAAQDLTQWLSMSRSEGLVIAGFSIARTQKAAATYGLDLIEELPDTKVEKHYGGYRLYFGDEYVDFAQAVALVYYNFPLHMGVLRAAKKIKPDDRRILVFMDRFPAASSGKLEPGEAPPVTPGMKLMQFMRKRAATNIGIDEENKKMNLRYEMTTLDWWKWAPEDAAWNKGKTHPNFTLTDWFVASSLAKEFPDEFVANYPASENKSMAIQSALCSLYDEYKKFDIWTIADDNTLRAIRANNDQKHWTVPDDARQFILDRTGT